MFNVARARETGCLVLVMLALAASPVLAQCKSLQPPGWDKELRLAEAPDLNPDPHIVEVNHEAAHRRSVDLTPGKRVDVRGPYNGGIPGPLLRVHVRRPPHRALFESPAEETTIHWHGLRVPIQMDGFPRCRSPRFPRAGRSPTTSSCLTQVSSGITRTSCRPRRSGSASTARCSSRIRPIRSTSPIRRARAERHRYRRPRRPRVTGQRRVDRHGVRPRGQRGARQRPPSAPSLRLAPARPALAHRQRREEPVLPVDLDGSLIAAIGGTAV